MEVSKLVYSLLKGLITCLYRGYTPVTKYRQDIPLGITTVGVFFLTFFNNDSARSRGVSKGARLSNMSSDQFTLVVCCIGDCTNELNGDVNKPLEGSR